MAKKKQLKEEGKLKRKRGRPRKDESAAAEEQQEKKKTYSWDEYDTTQRGLVVIFLFALAAISVLSFIGSAGEVGVWVDRVLGWGLGWGRYIAPVIFGVLGYVFLHPDTYQVRPLNYTGLAFFLLGGLGLLHLFIPFDQVVEAAVAGNGGGYLGIFLSYPLIRFAGIWVTIIVLLGLFVGSLLIMFNTSLRGLIHAIRRVGFVGGIGAWLRRRVHATMNGYTIDKNDSTEEENLEPEYYNTEDAPEKEVESGFSSKEVGETAPVNEADLEQMTFVPKKKTHKPMKKIDIPLTLLSDKSEKPTSGDIDANKVKIQQALESFGIDVEMGEVSVGPMVSQYTLKPSEGVKLTQITSLHNDIALALAAHPIRIEAPIPGKSLVGIEVPNKAIATVTLKQMLTSKGFKQRKDNLTLCLGKDVSGKPYSSSLQSMPHLLIAGATGSGKSVCINSIILSLIYQNSPSELRFIMVDPKRVELSVYNGIPHLLTPVVTDVEKTVNALKWTVAEMDRRYELLSREGKRSIEAYNSGVSEEQRMPYVVFIIDELADLMSVAANSVEAAIVRLAQMSRAVGIHLVLATQRPSVNVITGLIKANMPARIAFSVASLVDSRTILDFSGAEKLLGRGDMLFLDAQLSKPKRLQGAFIEDTEIENVVNFLRGQVEADYMEEVTEKVTKSSIPDFEGAGSEEGDDLLEDAKEVILQAGKASASLLQRRLRVGYARAARLLDILEEIGFIGPADGAKPREILVQNDAPEGMDIQERPEEGNGYEEEDEGDVPELDDTKEDDNNLHV